MPAEEKEILSFIGRFTSNGRKSEVIDTFTQGCCYWFARILKERFPAGKIVYDSVENHFACSIGGNEYDITGNVTGQYSFVTWKSFSDKLERQRIKRDCINF